MITLENASPEDAAALLSIYAPFIRDTVITFECDVPTVEEFAQRIISIQRDYPWIVCRKDGQIIGYAYASKHHERSAYQWSVNLSVYVDPAFQRLKVATALYEALFEILKRMGFRNGYAGITVPNEKSVRLHERFGFRLVGTYENVGYKQGFWRSVVWMEKQFSESLLSPLPPHLPGSIDCTDILKEKSMLIRKKM